MSEIQEETFDEAAQKFDLEKLKKDLEEIKGSHITEKPWKYFKEILCGHSPEDIANKGHWTTGSIKTSLSGNFSSLLKDLLKLEPDQDIGWSKSNVPKWLTEAGYGIQTPPQNAIEPKWKGVCDAMLKNQQETQKLRRKATEMGFEVDVFVGLGLVKRKQQQRRSGDVPMEQVHQLSEKDVIERVYEHDEFLKDVIAQDSTSKNKHIAIVGEAGAGKTTQLDRIAHYIQGKTQDLAICISLSGLQGKSLKDYILEEWLPEAIGLVDKNLDAETLAKPLQKHIQQGGVWLLLDGVDEMGNVSPAQALESIRNQLTGWLGQVRVVLTCRTNVWDASLNNPLTGFDTYKTQEFEPEQVDLFIQDWFAEAKNIQRGEDLKAKLKEPQKDRLRQLITNPLRLSLLCYVFYKDKNAELPETKAGLYEHFVRYFYEWKPTQTSVDLTDQPTLKEELHHDLGRLSIAGLDSPNRFRLPQGLVLQEMGEKFFKLAEKKGWLTLVDLDAETDEPVYAFFHPKFQEYFAALAIDDWHFFLNHIPENPEMATYRVFEPEWKEVFLLWIDCQDVPIEQKNELLNALIYFDDKCDGLYFYWKKAWRLAYDAVSRNYKVYLGKCLEIDEYGATLRIDEIGISLPANSNHSGFWRSFPLTCPRCNLSFIQKITNLSISEIHGKMLNLISDFDENDISLPRVTQKENLFFQTVPPIVKQGELTKKQLQDEFNVLKQDLVQNINSELEHDYFHYYWSALLKISYKMSYPDFYKAWHSQPAITHPEATEITPVGDTPTTQTLNQQLTDLASQLQPTLTTYPIVIDLKTLAGETDLGDIIEEFCYQINKAVCFEKKIPTVNKVSSLKNVFIEQLKDHLQVKDIAFILQNGQPYPELVTLCKRLVNAVYIGWVTDQEVDSDFRGFHPAQPNLVAVVQNWINGLG